MQASVAEPNSALWITLGVAALSSTATLIGVFLTQRAARRNQQSQLDADAAREKERRAHELAIAAQARELEQGDARWCARRDLYAKLISLSDECVMLTKP